MPLQLQGKLMGFHSGNVNVILKAIACTGKIEDTEAATSVYFFPFQVCDVFCLGISPCSTDDFGTVMRELEHVLFLK